MLPGARPLRRGFDRFRTPARLRGEIESLRETVERIESELAELREFSIPDLYDAPIADGTPEVTITRQGAKLSRPRRVLCSLGIGEYVDLLSVSSVTFRAYAERHGYDLRLSTRSFAPERAPSWSKVIWVRELLDEYDQVLWIDADAIFVDISQDIGDFVKPEKDLYLVEHTWEDGRRSANMGVFLIRSSDWSRRLLHDIWSAEQYINHRWWENAALLDMLGYELPADGSRPRKIKHTELEERVELIGSEWNSPVVAGNKSLDLEPRIRHHGRGSVQALRGQLVADLVTCRMKSRKSSGTSP
jgi:galactosyl transferase GMA12/MNN10 family